LRYLGISDWKMRFIQVHMTSLGALYERGFGYISRAWMHQPWRRYSQIAIILECISTVALAIEIAAVVEAIYYTKVLREEKV
jgi:hypothetical protein